MTANWAGDRYASGLMGLFVSEVRRKGAEFVAFGSSGTFHPVRSILKRKVQIWNGLEIAGRHTRTFCRYGRSARFPWKMWARYCYRYGFIGILRTERPKKEKPRYTARTAPRSFVVSGARKQKNSV